MADYTIGDFVRDLDQYHVSVKGIPEDISPQDAADKFRLLKVPIYDHRLEGDSQSLFKGWFPKLIEDKQGNHLFILYSGPGLEVCEAALKYLR